MLDRVTARDERFIRRRWRHWSAILHATGRPLDGRREIHLRRLIYLLDRGVAWRRIRENDLDQPLMEEEAWRLRVGHYFRWSEAHQRVKTEA